MKVRLLLVSLAWFVLAANARADAMIESIQQKLKDQGFYYGEINGRKDADTTAAIRRYQIRNGLKITGELNPETEKSLGAKRSAAAPKATATPAPPRIAPARPPETSDSLRELQHSPEDETQDAYVPGPRGLAPATSGIFDETPYEVAPPALQRRVLTGAQVLLARRGYYRGAIDGIYGPMLASALSDFQTQLGMEPDGRLSMETLAALGLLPGQQAPGLTAPRSRRSFRRPMMTAPNGEPIYVPR